MTTAARVTEKPMSNETIESPTPTPVVEPPKQKHKSAAKAKAAKKPAVTKKSKPKAERANKKAEVIALMKHAKGATLAEIMTAADSWRRSITGRALFVLIPVFSCYSGTNCA